MFKALPRQVFGRLQVSNHSFSPMHPSPTQVTSLCEGKALPGTQRHISFMQCL